MLLSEKEARALTEKLLSYVKADDAVVGVGSESYSHLRFAANASLAPFYDPASLRVKDVGSGG